MVSEITNVEDVGERARWSPLPLFVRFQEHAAHSRGVDGRLQPLLLLSTSGGAREVLRRVRNASFVHL